MRQLQWLNIFLFTFVLVPSTALAATPIKNIPTPPVGVVANPPPLHSPDPGVAPDLSGNIDSDGTPLIPTGTADSDPQPAVGQVTNSAGMPIADVLVQQPVTRAYSTVALWIGVFVLVGLLLLGWLFTIKKRT